MVYKLLMYLLNVSAFRKYWILNVDIVCFYIQLILATKASEFS